MITEVIMPKLGLTMDEGTILSWLKSEGDTVRAGEALLSVETDKVAIDVEAPAEGTLLKILIPVGATVPLGEILAFIGEPGEAVPMAIRSTPEAAALAAPAAQNRTIESVATPSAGPLKVSPIARKLAEENNIDLSGIQGSGPQGRIVEADIRAILSARERTAPSQAMTLGIAYKIQPLTAVRKVTALRLSESFRTIPHFYLSVEVNVASLVMLRDELSRRYDSQPGIHLTHTDLLLKALALTLPRHPMLNAAYYKESEIKIYTEINPGVAIATEHGLVVGVFHHADRMSLGEIARRRHSLAAKAQERQLTPQDISGGTFTLTNLGMYGVDDFSAIINPGQSAILAVGAIRERPVAEAGQLALRPTLRMTLAVDHRVADGAAGALFLKDIRAILETPDVLQH
jgi:pyruvate dehydrogenase E2 component (dihydrolipoamide acetyltransferase)